MRDDVVAAPPGSLNALLRTIEESGALRGGPAVWPLRVAYVGGLTVAAGTVGVLVWMSRRRPGLVKAG